MADVSQIKLPNGSVYDLIDEKSGYITAEYIENKTDYEIPVSRVGEIVVGETAIGTDSTNFPTSKAVVDYVDERVVQEMDAIDVGVTKVNGKTGNVILSASDIGAATTADIPQNLSDLYNDSGFITGYIDEKVKQISISSNDSHGIPILLASGVNGATTTHYVYKDIGFYYQASTKTLGGIKKIGNITLPDVIGTVALTSDIRPAFFSGSSSTSASLTEKIVNCDSFTSSDLKCGAAILVNFIYTNTAQASSVQLNVNQTGAKNIKFINNGVRGNLPFNSILSSNMPILFIYDGSYWVAYFNYDTAYSKMPVSVMQEGTLPSEYLISADILKQAVIYHAPVQSVNGQTGAISLAIPSKTSDLTNDSGYLTASDIASVMIYKGTKANYAALPSTGNTTGDVWHLTDTGAEWAWDGSAWQELGAAIDLSGYATKATTLAGYGITDAKIQNGTITLGSNTITPLTSFTETDPTVPSWAKASSKPTYTASEVGAMSTSHAANGITTAKINAWDAKSDFSGSYNDLTDKPTIPTIPTNVSAFTNDSGYLTSYTETDPTVPSWAKASSKPSYGLTEISGTDDLRAIEALTGTSGLLKKTAANTWTLDTNTYLTSYTETDPTVPSWAKQSSKPTYTAAEVGALPDSTVIPSKVSDLTNDSGFITSYTDEKVKTIVDSQRTYYLTGSIKSSVEATETLIKHPSAHIYVSGDSITRGYTTLSLGNDVATSEIGGKSGKLNLYSTSSNAIILTPVTGVTADRTITLPDKNGTIALTSDIPSVPTKVSDLTNDSGFISSYTETDPVFSASAAAGITSTDINNWNGKSDTDEKLSVTSNSTVGSYYPILNTGTTGVASTKIHDGFFKFSRSSSTQGVLSIGENGSAIGQLRLFTTTSGKYVTITPGTLTSTRTITLPDATGTVALTSDIPLVYSSTNTGGYLTMATLPIYDGTVV